MIDTDNILDDKKLQKLALWTGAGNDANDLAYVAEFAIAKSINLISVVPDNVKVIWPWLENSNIKIYSRFYLESKSDSVKDISELTKNINTAFKHGASGVQIFTHFSELENFVGQVSLIRDDLFFNKDLFIGMDINEVGPFDWEVIKRCLEKIRATGIILALPVDTGDKSDFVGRIYGALESWKNSFSFDLHFAFGEIGVRAEQTERLINSICPVLSNNLKFFVNI